MGQLTGIGWAPAKRAPLLEVPEIAITVASGLTGTTNIAQSATSATVLLGDPMPDFELTCNNAGSGTCTCTRGTCGSFTSYSATAMNTLVFGRGSSTCYDATSYYTAGMCDIFTRSTAANVRVVYSQTGLGFAGRTAGPVPTITVTLQGLKFHFLFLNGLLGFADMTMPPFTTSITGEGLTSGGV